MRNPLRKRYLREIREDFGKYAVIFLLLVLMISEVSGFLVADESMIAAYDESFTKYNIEDGNFTVEKQMNKAQEKRVNALGITAYELFFTDQPLVTGQKVRFFAKRDVVNLECLMEGAFPAADDEVALDRMFASNNDIAVGDVIETEDASFKVTGLIALSDYSTMYEDNSQMMFDALEFGVAVVTPERFAQFPKDQVTWRYAWKYGGALAEAGPSTSSGTASGGEGTAYKDDAEQKVLADDLMKSLSKEVTLTGYVPRYLNQAINFTGEDMGGDKQMMQIFLYIAVIIIAFVFGVTISNTIVKEANVIGTLRASGYTKGELIRHYMFLPVAVTVVAAIIGNILGYTVLKNLNAWLYYNSYSLPTYETLWNAQAFVETTIVPIVIMMIIDYVILSRKLKLSPLKFLRRDLRRGSRARALPLNKHIPFFDRFRVRIILQNMSNYIMLFVGVLFANLILMFGLMFPDVLDNYQESIEKNLLCNYQYILQLPSGAVDEDNKLDAMLYMARFQNAVETENADAEKFSAYSLKTLPEENTVEEEILLYGLADDSRYIVMPLTEDGVYISSAYAEKRELTAGDEITLKEAYEDTVYSFRVDGIYEYEGALCVFMKQDLLNTTFDLGKGTFTGYLSDTPVTDIDEAYIGQTIDLEALTRVSRQLDHSMGMMMYVVDVFSVIMFLILIYLLSKIIIEKNAQSISMAKILGYTNGEVSRLYILATSILVILFVFLTIPIVYHALTRVFRYYIVATMAGWIPFVISNKVYMIVIVLGITAYAVVAVLEYVKIARVPMEEALKNVE